MQQESSRGAMAKPAESLRKVPTGIAGLDQITGGGLPAGRPTLICGGAGCGKTLLATEFLARGILDFSEPGVYLSFEESAQELGANASSLGFDLGAMAADGLLVIDHVLVEPGHVHQSGSYNLDGLFIRLNHAVQKTGARRVVLDTLESLFAGLADTGTLRAELVRLFRWLKERGLTTVITGEQGEGSLTRHGLEEYISDCVILLDHRVHDQISTRRLRIVKYRGSSHGTNEYPFVIDDRGFSVLPITSLDLSHDASQERISTGSATLDEMLGGGGYFRGSSILISGTAGSGKSTLAAAFADATCRRGERCVYFAFEESPAQIMRNMKSVGTDLSVWLEQDLLRFHASRPTLHGLEMHLVTMHDAIRRYRPSVVIIDPVTSLISAGTPTQVSGALLRLVDHLKSQQITAMFTNLTEGGAPLEKSSTDVSSLMDTWIVLRDIELGGERNRGLYVLKSRGMAHSNQLREFLITSSGIRFAPVYVGPEGVLTGSARVAQEARERATEMARQQEVARKRREVEHRREAIRSQIAALQARMALEEQDLEKLLQQEQQQEQMIRRDRAQMAVSRRQDERPSADQP